MNNIKTALQFVKGVIMPRKRVYHLSFVYEPIDKLWYIDMPWPGDRYNLAMVAGSDKLLSFLDKDGVNRVNLEVHISKLKLDMPNYIELQQTASRLTKGAFYDVHNLEGFERDIWICPVTLCVLGHYPKWIYIKTQHYGKQSIIGLGGIGSETLINNSNNEKSNNN